MTVRSSQIKSFFHSAKVLEGRGLSHSEQRWRGGGRRGGKKSNKKRRDKKYWPSGGGSTIMEFYATNYKHKKSYAKIIAKRKPIPYTAYYPQNHLSL
jgi:hypothetical protein